MNDIKANQLVALLYIKMGFLFRRWGHFILLIRSFPNSHGLEIRPPSSRFPSSFLLSWRQRGAWLSARPRDHCQEKWGLPSCPLWNVQWQGGVEVSPLLTTAALEVELAMAPERTRSSPHWVGSIASLPQNLQWLSINYNIQIPLAASKASDTSTHLTSPARSSTTHLWDQSKITPHSPLLPKHIT